MKTFSKIILGLVLSSVATFSAADTNQMTANENDAKQVYSTVGIAPGSVKRIIEGPQNWHIMAGQGPQASCYIYSRPLDFSTNAQNIPDLQGLNLEGVSGPVEYKPEQDQIIRNHLEEGRIVRGGGVWGTILNRSYLQKERARNEEQGLVHDWNLEQRRYPYFDDGQIIWTNGTPRSEMAILVLWPDDKISNKNGEVSVQTGANLKQGVGRHALMINGRKRYQLYADGTYLYAHPKDDPAIVADLRASANAQLIAELPNGELLMDEYSLIGMVAATSEAAKRCN